MYVFMQASNHHALRSEIGLLAAYIHVPYVFPAHVLIKISPSQAQWH